VKKCKRVDIEEDKSYPISTYIAKCSHSNIATATARSSQGYVW